MKVILKPTHKYIIAKKIIDILQKVCPNGYKSYDLTIQIMKTDEVQNWKSMNYQQFLTMVRNIARELEFVSNNELTMGKKIKGEYCWFLKLIDESKYSYLINKEHQKNWMLIQWIKFKIANTKSVSKKDEYDSFLSILKLEEKEFTNLRNERDFNEEIKYQKKNSETTREQYLQEIQDILIEQTKEINPIIEKTETETESESNTSKYRLQRIEIKFILG